MHYLPSRIPRILYRSLGLALLASIVTASQAADFIFSGNIALTNDIVDVTFAVNHDTANVDVWTDSFLSGVNFDPVTALWLKSGSDYTLVAQNDDNPHIRPGQTYYDSGFHLDTLAAGDYLLTVAVYPSFANGTLLSEGFNNYGRQPAPLAVGTFWRVNLSNVDTGAAPPPVTAVPEPTTYALMFGGLGVLAAVARRRRKQG